MPSPNPVIALRLAPGMHEKIKEMAAAEHRSLSNFVEHHLRRLLGPQFEPIFDDKSLSDINRHAQVDIEDVIARAPRRRTSKTAKHK